MGWGRWLLLGDLGQQLDIEDQRTDVEQLRRRLVQKNAESRSKTRQIDELQAEIDELKLYIAATFTLLTAKGVVSPEEIKRTVEAVDRSDGTSDARFSGQIMPEK